jgi:hypothetical protein
MYPYLYKFFCASLLLFGLTWSIYTSAQENIAPIQFRHCSPITKTGFSTWKSTARYLPFFEDFNEPIPSADKWVEQQVYCNNTMGLRPISKGVATFDGLNQWGIPYDTINPNTLRYADSLTTKPIDLSSYLPSDSIYLSFFFQPAGNGFAPEKTDSLLLFFKSKSSSTWIKVWSRSDSAVQDFKQVMIPICDTNYLHSNFQFRFVNKVSMGINDDVWNLDYIRINNGRNSHDTDINDIAFTATPSNILIDYTAMPYRQYLALASAERATTFQSILRNNYSSNQTLVSYGYTANALGIGSLSSATGSSLSINAKNTADITFNTYAAAPSAGLYDKVVFDNQFYCSTTDAIKTNDTIHGQQIFDNYLAYDDGSAEMSYYLNLFPTLPGKIAIEQHLNQADTLRGLAIYFGRQVPLAKYKYFSIVVYKTIAYGTTINDTVIYQQENYQPNYIDTINHFWIYTFRKPIPLNAGTFYIGTTQPALSGSDSLYFGLDRNRISNNHLYYNVLNVWNPSLVSGALMIRPLLGQAVWGTNITERANQVETAFSISPNPAQDWIVLKDIIADKQTQYEIHDSKGSLISTGIVAEEQTKINISALTPGIYFIHIIGAQKTYTVQSFLKQ